MPRATRYIYANSGAQLLPLPDIFRLTHNPHSHSYQIYILQFRTQAATVARYILSNSRLPTPTVIRYIYSNSEPQLPHLPEISDLTQNPNSHSYQIYLLYFGTRAATMLLNISYLIDDPKPYITIYIYSDSGPQLLQLSCVQYII